MAITKPRVTMERIDSLEPYPGNPNRGDVDAIGESLDQNGWYGAVVVQTSTRRILAGHHRIQAVEERGGRRVPVVWADVDDAAAKRIVVGDNQIPRRASTDDSDLAALLGQLHDSEGGLLGTGYATTDYRSLLRRISDDPPASDDDAPPLPKTPITKIGDVITLGPHRLMCGDATSRADVATLMGDDLADMVFTDPPYAVAHATRAQAAAGGRSIHGDQTSVAISTFLPTCLPHLRPGGAVYIFGGGVNVPLLQKLYEVHLGRLPQLLIWDKEHFVLRHHGYHSQHEMIAYGWQHAAGRESNWYGDRKQSDVWRVPRDPSSDYLHPTQKPVELSTRAIRDSSPVGGVVLDPFGGSGSTLIGAERTDRACRMMEIDPAYCDVIRQRYENLHGTT